MGNLKRKSTGGDARSRGTKRSRLHSDGAPIPPLDVVVRGKSFEPTPAFDTFWKLAAERHAIEERRRSGQPPPWTKDPVLQNHKFCNTFRILDRGSQYLVTEVIEKGPQDLEEVTFRVLLFSLYTNISTYETLRKKIRPFTWSEYRRENYEKVLRGLYARGVAIYTGAYQKPAPDLGFAEAFMNHLALMEVLMQEMPDVLSKAEYMADVFEWLQTFKSMGDFTAYQLLLNLSYSNVMSFSDHDFVVMCVGSRRGLRRCFKQDIPRSMEVDLVRWIQSSQDDHFARLRLNFNGLGDQHRPMMLCDIEHTLCELDKYIRKCGQSSKGRPFVGTGELGEIRLPKAWSDKARQIVRIKNEEEAEPDIIEKFVVQSIEAHRVVDGMMEFLVFWEGYDPDEATWEPKDSLMEDAPTMVKAYLKTIT
ncbi:hypothetical protein F5J12DRAFT_20876 [Pisolithus orientalis]|uniref:uncharacterized protein n=1 Tax=Pisolithus orientalis TaxID=936130 RepID=UPI00222503EC|nr:uncharacterized protein F5J12DRAFT_20876 [Pisolithus orientalis]KAI6035301.1 hypothetical protein F5J12DRAFT_20876 [Pisolithus orientalis]